MKYWTNKRIGNPILAMILVQRFQQPLKDATPSTPVAGTSTHTFVKAEASDQDPVILSKIKTITETRRESPDYFHSPGAGCSVFPRS